MDPVTAILGAAAIAGAIVGGQRKHIDPNWLAANYGAHAVTAEAQKLFSDMIHSPTGQSIIQSASVAGQQFARQTQAQAAQAGMTPMGGAATGTGIFATSAGEGAANSLQQQTKSNLYAAVLPQAADIVAQKRQAYLDDFYGNGAPTNAARTWSTIGKAAGTALSLSSMAPGKATAPTNVGPAGSIKGFQPKALTMGQPMAGGGMMAGLQLPQYNPNEGWLQKSGRLFRGVGGSRFVNYLGGQ